MQRCAANLRLTCSTLIGLSMVWGCGESAPERDSRESDGDAAAQEEHMSRGPGWRASGNEPFWNVTISDDGIEFRQLGGDSLSFPYEPPSELAAGHAYDVAALGRRLVIVIEEAPCMDSMSGARFAHTARVELDGVAYEGCAAPPRE